MPGPLFILSSGRSGSTLLQRVLNTYDMVTIWGEHSGFLAPLADAYFRLLETRGSQEFLFPASQAHPIETAEQLAQCKDPRQWQAWINFITPEHVTEFFRGHVESFFRHPVMDDDHIWGFKEIRYGRNDRVIEFLHRLFPDAVFVFLCRNALSTLASQLGAFHGKSRLGRLLPSRELASACRNWRLQNETLRQWHLSGRLHSYWIRYEDLDADLEALRPVLDALHVDLGSAQQAVFEMEEGRGSAFASNAGVADRWRSLGYLPLLAAEAMVGELNTSLGYESPRGVAWFRALARPFVRRRSTPPGAPSRGGPLVPSTVRSATVARV